MAKKDTITTVDLEGLALVDETESRQFVVQVNGHRARMEYDRSGDRIFLTGSEVPKALEAHGVGPALIEKVLTWTEANRLKLVPMCPSVKSFLRRNTAWQRLLVKGVQI
ncbi:MAG TPA: GNAT family N-acetyltransferase [Flavobacteriales bacterium]